jgi:hypothetical protein
MLFAINNNGGAAMVEHTIADAQKPPASFRKIRLELAREPAHPAGDAAFGYVLFAPLDKYGKIDAELWRAHRSLCRVTRFRPNGEEEIGHLVHRPGGLWKFHYDIEGNEEDESGFRLGDELFVPGQYVSIKGDDGMHTYRVVSVRQV